MTDPRDLLRSYLLQRQELGEVELVLDRLSVAEMRALLADRASASPSSLSPSSPSRAAAAETARPSAAEPVRSADPGRRESAEPARRESADHGRRESAASREADAGLQRVDVHVRAGAPVPGSTPAPPSPRAPAAYVETETIVRLPVLAEVREIALGCPRCGLARTRRHVVFGEGPEDAEVMVVGEAPGAEEDASGRPFVGRAGRLLDLMLRASGFEREQIYVCNVLKCRPPQNRNPQPDEVEACSPYLLRQVELVKPRLILAFGNFAAQTLLGTDLSMGKLRKVAGHQFRGIPVVPTYHPSACLRTQAWARSVWEDLQRARDVLDAS